MKLEFLEGQDRDFGEQPAFVGDRDRIRAVKEPVGKERCRLNGEEARLIGCHAGTAGLLVLKTLPMAEPLQQVKG